MRIERDELTDADVREFVTAHLRQMFEVSPPESVHALDVDALRAPHVAFYVARRDDWLLLATGALQQVEPGHLEIKAMRTAPAARRSGVGSVLLLHLLDAARAEGVRRVSLETGTEDFFEPARRFYEHHGFVRCPPFAAYTDDPNSAYYTFELP